MGQPSFSTRGLLLSCPAAAPDSRVPVYINPLLGGTMRLLRGHLRRPWARPPAHASGDTQAVPGVGLSGQLRRGQFLYGDLE